MLAAVRQRRILSVMGLVTIIYLVLLRRQYLLDGLQSNGTKHVQKKLKTHFVNLNTIALRDNKHYQPKCLLLLNGTQEEVNKTKDLLKKDIGRPLPNSYFYNEAKNCGSFRWKYGYNDPYHKEPLNISVAYIINIRNSSHQFETLFHAIYNENNVYCVHIDDGAAYSLKEAIKLLVGCFQDNVFLASKMETLVRNHHSELLAEIHCMRDLLKHDNRWQYVINLEEDSFPLKSNKEIETFLTLLKDRNDMPGKQMDSEELMDRYRYIHQVVKSDTGVTTLRQTAELREKPPLKTDIMYGFPYYVATRHFTEFIFQDYFAQIFLKWLNETYSPRELYWATLNHLHSTPGSSIDRSLVSMAHVMKLEYLDDAQPSDKCEGMYADNLCIFGVGDLSWLLKRKELFARRVNLHYDHVVIDCLEKLLPRG